MIAKKQAAPCLAPTGKGLPTTSSRSDNSISERKCQFRNDKTPHLNQILTACEAGAEMREPVVVREAVSRIITEYSSECNGQSTQNRLENAENSDTSSVAQLDACRHDACRHLYQRLDDDALAVLEQIESGVLA